jgi:transcriptional regulator with XRE-family HTH domain
MVDGPYDPTVQRRRLRVELKRARQDANKTQRDVAEAMDWSTSKLIRIENGEVKITRNDLRALLDYYGVTDERRVNNLTDMARMAREDPWSDFRDVHTAGFLQYLGYESSAWIIRESTTAWVPGLLQTEEYNQALQREVFGETEEVAEKRWDARQRRQELHERDDPPQMFFIFDESVIRRQVGGPGVMRRQLQRIRELSTQRHVTTQTLPFSAGGHPGLNGPFIILEFRNPSDDNVLYLEQAGDRTTRDDPDETALYLERFLELEKVALSRDKTLEMLDSAIADLDAPPSTPAKEAKASKS